MDADFSSPPCNHAGRVTLVLALAAIVVFVALRAYSQARENELVHAAAMQIGQVRAAIAPYYEQNNFAAVATDVISKSMPSSMVEEMGGLSSIRNPFGGAVGMGATSGPPSSFEITLSGLPPSACSKLGLMDFGNSVYSIAINFNGAVPGDGSFRTPTWTNSMCAQNPSDNMITWAFH